MEGMKLVLPSEEYFPQIAVFRQDFINAGGSMEGTGSLVRSESLEEWLKYIQRFSREETVPEGLVPATQYLYVRQSDGAVVGMLQLRHYLNDDLKLYAGHIGYCVAPSERRKAYAKNMLADALSICKEHGINPVMICCKVENEASRRTIIANGGVYDATVHEPRKNADLERYFITL